MTAEREDPDRRPDDEPEEYPAGTEVPSEPAGVGDGVEDTDQPGLAEDPPEAD